MSALEGTTAERGRCWPAAVPATDAAARTATRYRDRGARETRERTCGVGESERVRVVWRERMGIEPTRPDEVRSQSF